MEQKPSSPAPSSSTPAKKATTPAVPKKTETATPKPKASSAKSTLIKKVADQSATSTTTGPKQKSRPAPKPSPPGAWRKWALGAGLLALLLGVGYGLFNWVRGDGSETPAAQFKKKGKKGKVATPVQQPEAPEDGFASTKKPSKPETPAGTKPKEKEKKPADKTPPPYVPVVAPKSKDVLPLTLARLATEYAIDPAETNRKYHAAFLAVSGRFQKLEQRATGGRPTRTHVVFQSEGRPLLGDLEATPTEIPRWSALKPGEPITVLGVYNNKEFCLHQCQLLPYQPPAETRYRGKKVELVGFVREMKDHEGFPALWLERAGTNTRIDVVCLFPKPERDSLKRLEAGTPVTLLGTCTARIGNLVRMDNCKLVETTAPEPPIERLQAAAFLRDWEEDQLLFLSPPPEEQLALNVTLEQLGTELAEGPKTLDKKYRHRVLNVSGLVVEKQALSSTVVLESGKTDHAVKVHCVFAARTFQELPSQTTQRIRGVCTGMINATTLRLDDCELVDVAKKKNTAQVTAEFFPHVPGQNLTYDLARTTSRGNREVIRQVFAQREDGLIETLTYYMGKLPTPLFEEKESDSWVHRPGTKKLKTPLPGPVFRHRVNNGFIEIGLVQPTDDGKGKVDAWEPVLKLGATQGSTWKWTHDNLSHVYTVLDLPEKGDRVVILETVRSPKVFLPVEVRHVYVRKVGEVERREWQYISTRDKKLLGEKKLVEESETEPPRPMPPKGSKEPAKKP